MRPPKYRNGDLVTNILGHKVRILRSYGKDGEIFYETEDCLSGSKTNYREEGLLFDNDNLKEDSKDYVPDRKECPKCGSSWSITGFGKKRWYDCKTCKKSAEELCIEREEPPKFNPRKTDWWTD